MRDVHWSYKYLNIPYHKLNCAQFVQMVLAKEKGVNFQFPQCDGSVFAQSVAIKKNMPVFLQERVVQPVDFDMVLMHGIRRSCHIGLFAKIDGISYVLHSQKKFQMTCLHKIRDLSGYGLTVEGFYRWQE